MPFSFIPCSGSMANPKPGPLPTRVRALDSRIACEITFPRLLGYRYELPAETLTAKFTDDSRLALTTADFPTKTENAPIVGETSIHTLDDLKSRRLERGRLPAGQAHAREILPPGRRDRPERPRHKFDSEVQAWLFPQLLAITKRWLAEDASAARTTPSRSFCC